MNRLGAAYNRMSMTARLLAGIAAALFVTAQASHRIDRDSAVDAVHSVLPAAVLPLLRSTPGSRVAPRVRPPARSSGGIGATVPEIARANPDRRTAQGALDRVSHFAASSPVRRGYDATAPPALD